MKLSLCCLIVLSVVLVGHGFDLQQTMKTTLCGCLPPTLNHGTLSGYILDTAESLDPSLCTKCVSTAKLNWNKGKLVGNTRCQKRLAYSLGLACSLGLAYSRNEGSLKPPLNQWRPLPNQVFRFSCLCFCLLLLSGNTTSGFIPSFVLEVSNPTSPELWEDRWICRRCSPLNF